MVICLQNTNKLIPAKIPFCTMLCCLFWIKLNIIYFSNLGSESGPTRLTIVQLEKQTPPLCDSFSVFFFPHMLDSVCTRIYSWLFCFFRNIIDFQRERDQCNILSFLNEKSRSTISQLRLEKHTCYSHPLTHFSLH